MDKCDRKLVFIKERESIKGVEYLLTITQFKTRGTDEFVCITDSIVDSADDVACVLSKLGFKIIGATDFFLEYEIEKGFLPILDSDEEILDEELVVFKDLFKFTLYYRKTKEQGK